ncbi:hypothetical protein SAMN05880574_11769 [Chryseobacterium sp. RU37D]|uniref:hypothetical protein n=1 Tax=Chryseobacterium sp. RU37D TaxID=1907397 RepID=UPI000955C6D5|nr:hypothetical protein [Chryseobacterium sp. RU37D]SIQ59581.1 hypothetical protein SAMN05880574_11769 [Chryseobacterium sp. RU37D]
MLDEVYFPVKYVLKNSKDTIKTKVLNTGLYSDEEFSAATYIRQMTILDASGKKAKVLENDISYMEITDSKNHKIRFIDSKSVLSKDIGLLQIMFKGKKSEWYRNNFYTGPIYTYKTDHKDYLLLHKDKSITEIYFKAPGVRPLLKEKFGSYPDLVTLIDLMAEDTDLLKILKKYESK